jgi:predicted GNAT family acetyltransferase
LPINLAESSAMIVDVASQLRSMIATCTTELLTDGAEAEVLTFLAARPIHTVCMMDMILENGLVSPLNRGLFYASRDEAGQLEGVALIGHATLIEARSRAALEAFAQLAQQNTRAHLIRGEQEMIERFMSYFAPAGYKPKQVCRELLFELCKKVPTGEPVKSLRPATLADLELVLEVNAGMIYEECGVNPLVSDHAGFCQRTARRIQQGRVCVWVENGRLIFKTDIVSATPEALYLEGVHVNSAERGKGYGLRCFTQLSNYLLQQAKAICLLVNEHNQKAIRFYQKVGYQSQGCYDTIYLK